MRPITTAVPLAAIPLTAIPLAVVACLALSACGSSRKTVVVNPPPGSTTVVDRDGHTHVIAPHDNYDRDDDR